MALLKFGAIVTSGSGSLGGHTIQHSKGGMQLRNKPIPRSTATDAQRSIRSINTVLQHGWQSLTGPQRKIWNDWPVTHGILNANGDKHPLSGHSLWMKYQFTRLFEHLPFLSNPSLHLLTYLGPELVSQTQWPTVPYWHDAFAPCWSADGIKLSSNGGYGFLLRSLVLIPGLFYQLKILAIGTGSLNGLGESPFSFDIPFGSLYSANGQASHSYLELHSHPFLGDVLYLSLKRIYNF